MIANANPKLSPDFSMQIANKLLIASLRLAADGFFNARRRLLRSVRFAHLAADSFARLASSPNVTCNLRPQRDWAMVPQPPIGGGNELL